MLYSEMSLENGKLITKNSKIINQSQLTSDCWGIQFKGLSACKDCEFKDTVECGGGETLKRMKKN